jgi:DNA-binding Lrp family transcriptional regulator
VNNQDYAPDKTDLKIIGLLARDSRLSYERIGSALKLTRNSIKTRIRRMESKGIIQEYIADINFALLGYTICYVFTKQEERSNRSSRNSSNRARLIVEDLNRLGDILAEIEVLGGISIFRVAARELSNYSRILQKDDVNIDPLLRNDVIQKITVASNTKSFQTIGHMRHHAYPTPSELKILGV